MADASSLARIGAKGLPRGSRALTHTRGRVPRVCAELGRKNFCKDMPNRGLFAVYHGLPGPFNQASRLFVTRSPRMLVNRLRALFAQGTILTVVFTCRLRRRSRLHGPDITNTLYGGCWPESKTSRNAATKRSCCSWAMLERKGGKPGPKRQEYASAWKIDTLRNLAKGARFEVAVTIPAESER